MAAVEGIAGDAGNVIKGVNEPQIRAVRRRRGRHRAAPSDEQHLYAPIHPRLENAGLRRALICGDCRLCRCPTRAGPRACTADAGGLRTDIKQGEDAGQRGEGPMPAEEPLRFLGCRMGWNYPPGQGIRICCRFRAQSAAKYGV